MTKIPRVYLSILGRFSIFCAQNVDLVKTIIDTYIAHATADSQFKGAYDALSPELSEYTPWDVVRECGLESHMCTHVTVLFSVM